MSKDANLAKQVSELRKILQSPSSYFPSYMMSDAEETLDTLLSEISRLKAIIICAGGVLDGAEL